MLGIPKWMIQVFSVELRKVMTYRVDFWLQYVMAIFANVGVAYFLWKAIYTYKNVEVLRGYSFSGLMLYYLMAPLIGKIINGQGMTRIAQEIYDGSLTRYLIYPVSFFQFKYMTYLAHMVMYFGQFILAIVIFVVLFKLPPDVTYSFMIFGMGIITLLIAGILSFVLYTTIELIAFWADNIWSLAVMVRFCVSLLGGAMIPLAFFPSLWEKILKFLPFSYFASFPIRCFLGKVDHFEWLLGIMIMVIWTGIFGVLAMVIWHRGKYKYTGVGI